MPYLVTSETDSQVDIKCIIGIAEDSIQVHSLLFNFYKQFGPFEESIIHYTITIYGITDDDMKYIESLYNKYSEKIEEMTSEYDLWNIEDNLYENYKCIPYESGEDKVMFTKPEVKKIKNIIKSANKIL